MKEILKIFDSLQVLNFENQVANFQVHYHETFCISLIKKFALNENEIIAPEECILISHPFEIHRNQPIEIITVSFSTFYISQDVVNFISPFDKTFFQNKVIENQCMTDQIKMLIQDVNSNKQIKNFRIKFYSDFYRFIYELTISYGSNKEYSASEPSILLEEVKQYISNNLNSKIDLNSLTKMVGMSKFNLTRWHIFKLVICLNFIKFLIG